MKDLEADRLHALLIGIDCYLPNRLPDGSRYTSLGGCVPDITRVEHFLRTSLSVPAKNIRKLTSTNTGAEEPPEPKSFWPTYENMVAAFQQLAELAQASDRVYIHYSGHGGRTPTRFPELKGKKGLDETLVPMDIGKSSARYLRDLELAYLLNKMVDKGLIVTIVLDSCHSGSATRGGLAEQDSRIRIRGLNSVDATPRPTESLVASDEELLTFCQGFARTTKRSVSVGSGWLPEPQGYVLLAACRASEFAREYTFERGEFSGALTYWLLDSLKQASANTTYKTLHDRILAKVHSFFPEQTPQLEGEAARVLFGSEPAAAPYAVNVMQVDLARKRVLLNTGLSQGVNPGARFEIYPPGVTNFAGAGKRLALVEISELDATSSWAKIIDVIPHATIEQGSQAVLLHAGKICVRRAIKLLQQNETVVPRNFDQTKILQLMKEALQNDASGFLLLASETDSPDFQVVVTPGGEYQILDSAGEPLPNLRPALKISDSGALARLVQRLVHLAKFYNIKELSNYDFSSPLIGKLRFELVGWQDAYAPGQRPAPKPFKNAWSALLKPGQWVFLRAQNHSDRVLNLTALDLQPDWGIKQIYPVRGGGFVSLDPGQEIMLPPLRANLPEDYTTGTDIIKLFATVGATNFRWLELPPLDQPSPPSGRVTRGALDPLQALFAALAVNQPKTRHLEAAANPGAEWVTAQVELRVEKI